ncbi:Membrane associated serine protease, rhomboid family [Fodinibius salinus]|uniref:Membrane associated serine protease, rhomboid family n=1 Tax=Fodinibius salinus TaxID=860790 RepID=A0A5D3YQF9_9BACT|nr:rhomboid family intramembrane serine protease [Fodinibius salinus]TYP95289.1 Membrane associated serine protease, rhomboid family [Fodinibius salinus]
MNYQNKQYSPNTELSIFPPAVKHLLIINVLVFIAMWTPNIGTYIQHFGMLYPIGSGEFHVWQLVSYMFLHAGFGHIFFNLFALWMFGQSIENIWGTRRFTIYYLLTGIGAALLHMFISGGQAPMLGASGAVYGILLAFGMMFPNRRIMLLFPPIPMKAKYFVAIFGVIEFVSGISRTNSNVAHFAHLGGMLVGFILIKYWGLKSQDSYQ